MRRVIIGATLIFAFAGAAIAADGPGHKAPYAGQQSRAISSFSQSEINDLFAGKGMGLAKPAELNGYPGPLHVLELADKLSLTQKQRAAVQLKFDAMKTKAKQLGRKLIDAERALDTAFRSKTATALQVRERLGEAARLRAALRLAHLEAHLKTAPLLTVDQRQLYARLRGHADAQTRLHRHQH